MKERRSTELFNEVSKEYVLPSDSSNPHRVDAWVNELAKDAQFNFSAYADCFISENLLRKFMIDKNFTPTSAIVKETEGYRNKEINYLERNKMIQIRQSDHCLSYLTMHRLAEVADILSNQNQRAKLQRDADDYKPLRDAVAHTALLTEAAKAKLTSVYMNIKDKIRYLLMS